MTELFDTSIDITYNAIVHGHNNHTTNWMLLKCDNSLRLIAYGVNGFSECRTELKDKVPLYGFIRIEDIYLFLDWQPSSVENEALNEHKSFHQALLDKFTYDDYTLFQLTASTLEELNDDVIDKILSQRSQHYGPHHRGNDKDSEILESDNISDDDDDDDDTYEQAIDDEKLQLEKEEEEQKKLEKMKQLEEEEKRKKEEELEIQRLQKLKQLEERLKMEQGMLDANNSGDVLIDGYLSVKSHNSPFWRRQCIQIQNRTITISSEEKPKDQIKSIPLTNIKRYGKCDIDRDCYITNAAVLETEGGEVWQFLAENQNELYKILKAIEICTS